MEVTQDAIRQYVGGAFSGVDVVRPELVGGPKIAWGDTFFIYDPNRDLEAKYRFPFATIVTKNYGDFDHASELDRPGVFRLNVGIGKETYRLLFGPQPAAPAPGSVVSTGHDFTTLDRVMPHPVYAAQSWVCVLSPSEETFAALQPLIAEAYELAASRRRQS